MLLPARVDKPVEAGPLPLRWSGGLLDGDEAGRVQPDIRDPQLLGKVCELAKKRGWSVGRRGYGARPVASGGIGHQIAEHARPTALKRRC